MDRLQEEKDQCYCKKKQKQIQPTVFVAENKILRNGPTFRALGQKLNLVCYLNGLVGRSKNQKALSNLQSLNF